MSKIPEDATHTAPDGTYRMARGSLWYGYADGDWVYIEGAAPHCYTKIQAEPEWVPLSGYIVHCGTHNRDVEILKEPERVPYVSAPCRALDNNELFWGGQFSPIKTPEQIAAEKRDAAIKEMQRLVGSCNTFPFAELYDYGYRLQVEK